MRSQLEAILCISTFRLIVLSHSGMLEMVDFISKQPGLVSVMAKLTEFLGSRYFLIKSPGIPDIVLYHEELHDDPREYLTTGLQLAGHVGAALQDEVPVKFPHDQVRSEASDLMFLCSELRPAVAGGALYCWREVCEHVQSVHNPRLAFTTVSFTLHAVCREYIPHSQLPVSLLSLLLHCYMLGRQ